MEDRGPLEHARDLVWATLVATLMVSWIEGIMMVFASQAGEPNSAISIIFGLSGFLVLQFLILFAPRCFLDPLDEEPCCCCSCTCCCCRAPLHRLMMGLSDDFLVLSLPFLLFISSLLPHSSAQLWTTQFALLSLIALAHRDLNLRTGEPAEGDQAEPGSLFARYEAVVIEGMLLSMMIRGAGRTENVMLWDFRFAWALCLPAVGLQMLVMRARPPLHLVSPTHAANTEDEAEAEGSVEPDQKILEDHVERPCGPCDQAAPAEDVVAMEDQEGQVSMPMTDLNGVESLESTLPEKEQSEGFPVRECGMALSFSCNLILAISVAGSPGLLVRGSGVEPTGYRYTLPLLLPIVLHLADQASGGAVWLCVTHPLIKGGFGLHAIQFLAMILWFPTLIRGDSDGRLAFGSVLLAIIPWSLRLSIRRVAECDTPQLRQRFLHWMSRWLLAHIAALFLFWFSWSEVVLGSPQSQL